MTQPTNREIVDTLTRDPIELSRVLFDSKLWFKQKEIIRSVWENKYTAVKSCNTGGKTRIAAEIILLYLLTFRPSRVVTTAPTFTQVSELLWKEVSALYGSSKYELGGQLNQTSLNFGTIEGLPWDAIGISTDEINRFQGWHSPHLLLVFDEALGVKKQIWEAGAGLRPHRQLVIGNPLDPSGDFYNCFQSSLWNKITISGPECVAWQKEHGVIPGLITQEWIDERADEWGINSPEYIARVLGEFPEDSPEYLIQRKWVNDAREKESEDNIHEDIRIEACDVASKHGKSETVMVHRFGHTLKEIKIYQQIPITKTRDILAWDYVDKKLDSLVIDADGMGEGLDDMLIEKHLPFSAFHGGRSQKALDDNKYKNLRTQFYHIVAKKFEKGLYSLKDLSDKEFETLKNQLCCIKVKPPDPMGRMQIETKDDLMGRGIRSPDIADSFMMAEYGFYMGKYTEIEGYKYR